MSTLSIQHLHATIQGKKILHGVDLTIRSGEIHAIMGPNGSGKSTLANLLMGKPSIATTNGTVVLDQTDIFTLTPTARAQHGLFLGFQYPVEIPGVTVSQMLRLAYNSSAGARTLPTLNPKQFQELLRKGAELLGVPTELIKRPINEGFSGGEKKRMEMLQCWALSPKFAILDETDSGLDIDALKTIANGIQTIVCGYKSGILLITHYQRILQYIQPDFVHVFVNGTIVESGTKELAERIEHEGYAKFTT